MVKIRIEGTPEECQQATPELAQLFDVVSISDPLPQPGPEPPGPRLRRAPPRRAAPGRPGRRYDAGTIRRAGPELPPP